MPSSAAEDGRARAACLLSVALALGLGLCGVDWGLPGPDRFAALPPRVRGNPQYARHAADAWAKLYEGIAESHRKLEKEEPVTYVKGVEVLPAGWTWPPDALINSYRSLMLRTEHPDEQKSLVVLARMRPWKREFQPLYLEYGGAFIYPLGAWLWAASKTGAVTLVSDVKRYLAAPAQMGELFLWARLHVLLFHALTVAAVFLLARQWAGVEGGFCAAALYAVLPVVVVQTHVVKPHPVAAFWLCAALLAAVKERYVLSGALAGAAAGANFSLGGFVLLPVLASWNVKRGALAAAAFAAVLAATNPYVLFSPGDYLWETTVYPAGHSGPSVGGLLRLLGPHLTYALGAGLHLASALAAVSALRRRTDRAETLTAAVVVFGLAYLWLGLALLWGFSGGPGAARFFYALFPPAAALGGAWLARGAAPAWLRAALLLLAFGDAGRRSVVYLENLRLDPTEASTRARAADWLHKNLPAGSALGLTRFPQPADTPPFRLDRYKLVVFSDPKLLDQKTKPALAVVDDSGRSILEPAGWTEEASFRPAWERLAPLTDDSFFANVPMHVMRPPR